MNPGDTIADRYRLDAPLGEGGFATVWLARDLEDGGSVAVKFLKNADVDTRRRFALEARALARLEHANCPRMLNAGAMPDGTPYLVMERVEGRPLSDFRGQRLPMDSVLDIAAQIADVLSFAHRRGVIHRDLKPENIMLGEDGAVSVLDFGIAKIAMPRAPDLTKTGDMIGTPHYMGPEQLRGERGVGPAADQYALGVLLFELIEGKLPFDGPDLLAVATAHLLDPPPEISRPECPEHLKRAIAQMLAKNAADRFGNLNAVARALRGQKPLQESIPERSNTTTIVMLVGVLILGVAALAWASLRPDAAASRPSRVEPERRIAAPTAVVPPIAAIDPADAGTDADAGALGCGWDEFEHGLSYSRDGAPVWRYVPKSYDSSTEYPLIVLLTGDFEEPKSFLAGSGFPEIAEQRGVLVVAPETLVPSYYEPKEMRRRAAAVVRQESDYLCVDPDRVFVVGHSHGASGVEHLTCATWAAGVAISSFGLGSGTELQPCNGVARRPMISLWPLKSRKHPVEGGYGGGCRERPIAPLESVEEGWLTLYGCDGEASQIEHHDGTCFDRACDVPFRSCHLDGGHGWPGTPPRQGDVLKFAPKEIFDRCDGEPADFPSAAVVWEFFDSLNQ